MNPDSSSEFQPKESQYGEVLLDKSKLFHGVGFDTLRFKSILEHGILSERAATEKGIALNRNFGGSNLDDTVSVTFSPAVFNTFTFGAFPEYVNQGIGFAIERRGLSTFPAPRPAISGYESIEDLAGRSSGYPDETYVRNEIPPENIVGVMVPEDALLKPVSELPLRPALAEMAERKIDKRCRGIIADLEKELGYKADTAPIEELLQQQKAVTESNLPYYENVAKRKEVYAVMEKTIQSYIGQAYAHAFQKENVLLRDVLTKYLSEDMPVYNANGFPIDIANESS
jgi:hypothetical protein